MPRCTAASALAPIVGSPHPGEAAVPLPQPEVLESLGVRHPAPVGHLLCALADELGEVPVRRAGAVTDLALVGLEGLDLEVDRLGDVDPHVGRVGPADVDLLDLVRLE